jgi:pyrroline-5-carboxylate reductase
MGSALVAGLVNRDICTSADILVCEIVAERREQLRERYRVVVTDQIEEVPRFAQTLILAVKPMHLQEVGSRLRPLLRDHHLVVSILAGQTRQKLEGVLGRAAGIVRVMPNLPAQVGAGVSAVTFGDDAGEDVRSWVREILSAVGEVVEVEEDLQDAVTAVSGSGPGFLFYLAAQMIAGAETVGLPRDVARSLVIQTMLGTAKVLVESSADPADLVRKVATPGGTTEAGLAVLANANLPDIIRETLVRATERSKELGRS